MIAGVSARGVMDYAEGLKKEVAEIKFLIHDLRVQWFFNEVIHYHVSLNTDLEIHGVEQAQILHGADLDELKSKAREVRKHFRESSGAVTNFSPGRTVLPVGLFVDAEIFGVELRQRLEEFRCNRQMAEVINALSKYIALIFFVRGYFRHYKISLAQHNAL